MQLALLGRSLSSNLKVYKKFIIILFVGVMICSIIEKILGIELPSFAGAIQRIAWMVFSGFLFVEMNNARRSASRQKTKKENP